MSGVLRACLGCVTLKAFVGFEEKNARSALSSGYLGKSGHLHSLSLSDRIRGGFKSSSMDLENQWPKTIFRQFTLQKIRRNLLYILWNANYASPKNCPGCPRGPRSCPSQIDRVFCFLFNFFDFLNFDLFFHDFDVVIKKYVEFIWIFGAKIVVYFLLYPSIFFQNFQIFPNFHFSPIVNFPPNFQFFPNFPPIFIFPDFQFIHNFQIKRLWYKNGRSTSTVSSVDF